MRRKRRNKHAKSGHINLLKVLVTATAAISLVNDTCDFVSHIANIIEHLIAFLHK